MSISRSELSPVVGYDNRPPRQGPAAERARRHLRRHNAETNFKHGDSIEYGYTTELYTSVRFRTLDHGFKFATCQGVLLYLQMAMAGSESDGTLKCTVSIDAPPMLKRAILSSLHVFLPACLGKTSRGCIT